MQMKQLTIVALVVLMQLGGMVVLGENKECYQYYDDEWHSPELPPDAVNRTCGNDCICTVSCLIFLYKLQLKIFTSILIRRKVQSM